MNEGLYKYYIFSVFILLLFITGCSREDEERVSGIDTIESTLYSGGVTGYYAIGFSFDQGKSISTDSKQKPDITVHPLTDPEGKVTGGRLDTFIPVAPFALASSFDTAAEAKAFYDALDFVSNETWASSADPIRENQVWIFKTGKGNYAKFRIIELSGEKRTEGAWASVKFEWRVQPDGSTTF